MYYVELSVKNPISEFTAGAKVAGASVKVLMTDPKWTMSTVRLFSNDKAAVDTVLKAHFAPAIASMHSGAIKIGV